MLKFIYGTVVLVLFSIATQAQYSVTGIVRDSKNNQSLPGASVYLTEKNQFTITDQFGRFHFANVGSGEYTLSVTFMGYEKKEEKVSVSENVELVLPLLTTAIITDAVVVTATRATDKTPTTFTNVTKETIQKQNFGQDLPFLLNWTPSVVTTSDAGTGVGYTGIRIRGSDGTRINVTINGIPYNDSESLGTFWVDIPDIASSSQSIQIQRGVGTSTNGSGAFGASINLQTNVLKDKAYGEVINSLGSFKTRRHTLSFGSGLLNNHWVVEGRVSKISSDGFIDRASSDLSSYYFTAGFYSKKTIVKAVTFGGKERTYQSWYGVPESRLNNDLEAMEMTAMNEGWNAIQLANLKNSNSRTFNPYFYKNQVDNYQQDHFQLHFSQQLSSALTLNTALHYTPGKGYYEEYRYKDDFEDYGVDPITIGDSVISTSDIVRRRWLKNDFYGFTYSLNYDRNNWNIIFGGGWNRYDGDHFGEILWAEVSPVPTEHQYYFNTADKRDFNTFLKSNYEITDKLNAFVDLQYRKVTYDASGIENKQNRINFDAAFNFFNPKAGLTFSVSDHQQLYGSFAIANREPVREDFMNATNGNPEHEKLQNLEIGYRHVSTKSIFHANYYLMNYTNQFVLTGQLNDVGSAIRKNSGESYRMGIELEAALKLSQILQWNVNVTLSRNKIKEYSEVLEDYGITYENYPAAIIERKYKNTNISFSPDIIAGSQLTYQPFVGGEVALLSKYVGRQYLDNTSTKARSLDAYVVNDLRLTYTWKPSFVKEINFSFLINNILKEEYESNGYTWGYMGGGLEQRENYYYPQAGRNFLGMITLKF